MGELRECPFCGGKAAVFQLSCGEPKQFCVECEGCKCGTGYWSKNTAISRWNRRAVPAGFVLVPREPTQAMLTEFAVQLRAEHPNLPLLGLAAMSRSYTAMLAAAGQGDLT